MFSKLLALFASVTLIPLVLWLRGAGVGRLFEIARVLGPLQQALPEPREHV